MSLFDMLQGRTPSAEQALAMSANHDNPLNPHQNDPLPYPADAQMPPAPAAQVPAAGGASPSMFERLNPANIMQGDGIFADRSQDNEIDPDTGATKGFIRKANSRSMLQTSLMLLAAGAATDDGARSQILSQLPNAMDNTDKIQNFARTRLEMAKAKLAQQQQLQAAAQEAAWQRFAGGGGGQGAASGAPGAMPSPAAASPPIQGGMDPGQGGPMQLPGAQLGGLSPSPAPANPPAPAGNPTPPLTTIGAAAGAPGARPITGGPNNLPLSPAKSMPVPPAPDFTPEERQAMGLMKADEGRQFLATRAADMAKREYQGQPYYDAASNKEMIPNYRGGQFVSSTPVGDAVSEQKIEANPNGDQLLVTRDPSGRVLKQEPYDPHSQKQADQMDVADRATLKDRYSELKPQSKDLINSADQYKRINDIMDNINRDKILIGPGSSIQATTMRVLDQVGVKMSDEQKQTLANTQDADAFLKNASAMFAKRNNTGQITDADQRLAEQVIGALGSTDKTTAIAALGRIRQDLRDRVNNYNDEANQHNGLVGSSKSDIVKGSYKVPVVQGDFKSEPAAGDATPKFVAPQAAAPAMDKPRGAFGTLQAAKAPVADPTGIAGALKGAALPPLDQLQAELARRRQQAGAK